MAGTAKECRQSLHDPVYGMARAVANRAGLPGAAHPRIRMITGLRRIRTQPGILLLSSAHTRRSTWLNSSNSASFPPVRTR
jgi:hypothetical protein